MLEKYKKHEDLKDGEHNYKKYTKNYKHVFHLKDEQKSST